MITLGPANLSKTLVFSGEAYHPKSGITGVLYTHLLGFQSRAETDRPNAVVLPIPTKAPLGPDNVVSLPEGVPLFRNMERTLKGMLERAKGGPPRQGYPERYVFHAGSYTVVLAKDASQLPMAIMALPEDLRPVLTREIQALCVRQYPQWPLALCAWNGRIEAEPLLWWYEPRERRSLFLPTLVARGAHPEAQVERDQTLLVGSTLHPFGITYPGAKDRGPFLSDLFWGQDLKGPGPNGDTLVAAEDFRGLRNVRGRHDLHARLDPKVWNLDFEVTALVS